MGYGAKDGDDQEENKKRKDLFKKGSHRELSDEFKEAVYVKRMKTVMRASPSVLFCRTVGRGEESFVINNGEDRMNIDEVVLDSVVDENKGSRGGSVVKHGDGGRASGVDQGIVGSDGSGWDAAKGGEYIEKVDPVTGWRLWDCKK